jgi:excinuclease ABC subunit C
MQEELKKKLKSLPVSPGIYFHKDKNGEVIYVGKAAVLRNRVRHYFQNTKNRDVKTQALVDEIADTDWIETESEIDALFLESEMVKRYMPRYNILLRDDKSLIYIRVNTRDDWPYVSFTRNPADDGAEYMGPYFNSFAIRKALRYLRRIFPYYTKPVKSDDKPDLYAHMGWAPLGMSSREYKANIRRLVDYINGGRKAITRELEREMAAAASVQDYEDAARIRNKLWNLNELQRRIMFGDKEFLSISKDEALSDLSELLYIEKIPARIEGFDVSHMSGQQVVASMVVFKNGVSDRAAYRKFKTKTESNNDYGNMKETVARRLSPKNLKDWGVPDLVLIDGGKGQLDAALQAYNESGQDGIIFIGLAKREEQIVLKGLKFKMEKLEKLGGFSRASGGYDLISLPESTHIVKLLQRIRDESHRFAVSYHESLRRNRQTASVLDDIPGIGPKTRAKLIRKFGSLRGIKNAEEADMASVIGQKKAKLVLGYVKGI